MNARASSSSQLRLVVNNEPPAEIPVTVRKELLSESYRIAVAGIIPSLPSYDRDDFSREFSTNGADMAELTREELDAKLATVEARTETRFVELSGKIDRVADAVTTLSTKLQVEMDGVKEDNKTTRWTIVTTIVVAVLAAIGALWVTQANLLAAFTAGLGAHGG